MNRVLDAFVGGWQIAGTYRQTSGLPFSISDGSRWATNWELSSFAVPNGQPVPATVSSHNTPAAGGGPNLWLDPKAALAGFQEALAGQTGSRNTLRGDGFFDIDSAVSKSFSMPWSEKQKLSFRWEAYNVTNSVRFDPNSAQRQPDHDLHFRPFERNSSALPGRWSSHCGSRSKFNRVNRGGGLSSSPPFSLIDSEFP